MKKGLLIMTLILGMILTLTLFSGNKTEAYYGSYGYTQPYSSYGYTQPYAGYGYAQPYTGYGYAQPYSSYEYTQPYIGYGYSQPYAGYGYAQPYAGYGYGAYGVGSYGMGGYGYGLNIVSTEGGAIFVPARVGEPSSQVPGTGSGGLFPVSNPPQNPTQPVPAGIFPSIMPSVGTSPITYPGSIIYQQPGTMLPWGTGTATYPGYPTGSGQLWSGLPAMPASQTIFPQTPAFLPNPYWPNVYPTVPYPVTPGSIPITR